MMDFVFIASGLILLVFAGDALVRGAVALSLKLGISALVVSLTVVAFGTSAPELLVAIKATSQGATGIVYGNVVGSNIANVLLVLGIPALIAPIVTGQDGGRRNFLMMLASSMLFIAVCSYGGLTFHVGVAFLLLLIALLYDTYHLARKTGAENTDEVESDAVNDSTWKVAGLIAAGVIGLPLGAHFLIDGARNVALSFGLSEAVIGLTLVAIGTSLPELATTVMAAIRRQSDVAVGNVIGSNMFNILAVMGVASFFGDLPTPPGFMDFDLWIMIAASLALAPFIFLKRDVGKIAGIAFLAAYAIYIIFALAPQM
ncbi:MAG: calcium/sodium antiporter [Pikeienuella sp.]